MKEKLKLRHLAPYLPYGLKILNGWGDVKILNYTHLDDENNGFINHVKPILRPLSDLTKEIEVNGERFVPDLWFQDKSETMFFEDDFLRGITRRDLSYNINQCSYNIVQKLFEWHFDVFGLIEKGLAIDINSLKK